LHASASLSECDTDDGLCVTADRELDDVEMHVTRIKPEGLDVLCRDTKFTRKELQIMYRGFKQVLACSRCLILQVYKFNSQQAADAD